MKSIRLFSIALFTAGMMAFTGCGGNDADVNVETRTDTTTTVGEAASNAGEAVKGESIQKVVEGKLLAMPGFEKVDVESQQEGVIVLNGSVASENQKAQAQVAAENTDGVKQVVNNLTIAQ